MPQQGTKMVRVEGKLIRVPADATPDEIDQIATGAAPPRVTPRPEANQPGAMQRTPGGPIFTPNDIQRGTIQKMQEAQGNTALGEKYRAIGENFDPGNIPFEVRRAMNDAMLRNKDYGTFAEMKENDPARKSAEQEGMRYANIGIRPDVGARIALQGGLGTLGGGLVGKYLGGTRGEAIGAGLGGIYGGIRGGMEKPVFPGGLSKLLSLSRWGNALQQLFKEEPNQVAGTAREMAGGTAATAAPTSAAGGTGAGLAGTQAGPAAPKSASELSSVVQRTRSGTAPGMASTTPTIVTPEQAAQESRQFTQNQAQARAQGMANAARNPEAPGSAAQIPGRFTSPELTPRPSTPTVASTTQPGFSGVTPSPTVNPGPNPAMNPLLKTLLAKLGVQVE